MADLKEKKRGPVSKNALYQAASAHAHDAIAVLVEIMKNSEHDASRIGAARTLLNKCLPDLKATELTGKDGETLNGLILIRTNGDQPLQLAN